MLFLLQKWLNKCATMLHQLYIAYLVLCHCDVKKCFTDGVNTLLNSGILARHLSHTIQLSVKLTEKMCY